MFDGPIETLPFPAGTFDVVLAPWKLDTVVDIEAVLGEIVRVTTRTSRSRIVILQGAPDNEVVQFLNTTPSLPQVSHQGHALRLSGDYLADRAFGDISLRRIHGQYMFSEKDVSERCKAAASMLSAGSFGLEDRDELISRLDLHFQGSKHTIGNQMVMLEAKPVLN